MNMAQMSENQLKAFIHPHLEQDFYVDVEVRGTHIVEQVVVIADFLLRPKPHLIARNFDDVPFALEVKAPTNNGQYRKGVAQAASYVDSLFAGVRPQFALIFPHRSLFTEEERKREAVTAYFHLAQYFNVGDFEFDSTAHTWCIQFGGGRYFCSEKGRGPHNLTKRYTGNINS